MSDPVPATEPLALPRARPWIRWLEALLTLAVLGVVIHYLWRQLESLDADALRIDLGLGVLATVLLTASYLLLALVLSGFYRALGHPTGLRDGLALGTIPRLARYLPGKVPSALSQAWMARRLRATPYRVSVSVVVLMSAQGAAVSVVAVGLFAPWSVLPGPIQAACAAAGLLALVGLHPALCLGPINWLLRRLGREPVVRVGLTQAAGLAAVGLLQRLSAAGLFVLLALAIVPVPLEAAGMLALTFIAATLAGFLAFFTPGGLGVQEGAMALMLGLVLPADQAALLTVAARIWQTLATLLAAALGGLALVGRKPQ